MREKRNAKLDAILDEFRGLKRLAPAADVPIKHRRNNIAKQPSPDEFAEFLADIFAAERLSGYRCSEPHDEDISTKRVPPLEIIESQDALRHLRTGKPANGVVLEMTTFSNLSLHEKAIGRRQFVQGAFATNDKSFFYDRSYV